MARYERGADRIDRVTNEAQDGGDQGIELRNQQVMGRGVHDR